MVDGRVERGGLNNTWEDSSKESEKLWVAEIAETDKR